MTAYSSDAKLRIVKKDRYVGAARRKMDGIAIAEPMIVCGQVNRHSTIGKGGVGDFRLIVVGRDDDDEWSLLPFNIVVPWPISLFATSDGGESYSNLASSTIDE